TEEAVAAWHAPATGGRGGQPIYSATAIETGLALRLVFHQSLRQTEGLLGSIADMLDLDIAIPDRTTLSRRLAVWPSCQRRSVARSPCISLSIAPA
ncbi:MAG: transposase, partial [Acetobacteraceae bacterium]